MSGEVWVWGVGARRQGTSYPHGHAGLLRGMHGGVGSREGQGAVVGFAGCCRMLGFDGNGSCENSAVRFLGIVCPPQIFQDLYKAK